MGSTGFCGLLICIDRAKERNKESGFWERTLVNNSQYSTEHY